MSVEYRIKKLEEAGHQNKRIVCIWDDGDGGKAEIKERFPGGVPADVELMIIGWEE